MAGMGNGCLKINPYTAVNDIINYRFVGYYLRYKPAEGVKGSRVVFWKSH
jgi:hypothetical protein